MTTDKDAETLANPEIIELVRDKLEELRKRLLDSTRRNPLININFRPNSAAVMRVVDELPDVLRHNLISGTAMRLVPLPALEEELADEQSREFQEALFHARRDDETFLAELDKLDPSAQGVAEKEDRIERRLKGRVRAQLDLPERQTKEALSLSKHAISHGISPNFALPVPEDEHEDGRHTDTDIQTLMLPEKLSRTAKGILERGRSFERETGVNVLHAAFGILEWKSPGERDKYTSPLLLLEIRVERRQSPGGAQFYISSTDQITANLNLNLKLLSEHKLDVPTYEGGSVEDYFETVAEAAPKGWHWKIRREVVFGIFPSSKIAMYHDLDPEKRPLAENPVIGRLMATTGGGGGEYAGEYGTDDPEVTCKVPYLVMDADASQYSALVDIADGKSVALEGPPGSGKSQTIVNLISAALADGKKVLFVAEKLTALDVVKNRLESVGLGDFILPLQARKSSSVQVYSSLVGRIQLGRGTGSRRDDFTNRQDALDRRRSVLQTYLDTLAKPFGTTGMTVFETIGHGIATSDIRNTLPKEVRRIQLVGVEAFTEETVEGIRSEVNAFAERFKRLNRIPAFWLDARAMIFNRDDAEDICDLLAQTADHLENYADEIARSGIAPLVPAEPFKADMDGITALMSTVASNADKIDPALVEVLIDSTSRKSLRDFCGQMRERQTYLARLARILKEPDGWNIEKRLASVLNFANEQGGRVSPNVHSEAISRTEEKLRDADAILAAAIPVIGTWTGATEVPLSRLQTIARDLLNFPQEVRSLRRADADNKMVEIAGQIEALREKLGAELSLIRKALPLAGQHEISAVRIAAETIRSSGKFRFLSGSYKAARNTYRNTLGGHAKENPTAMACQIDVYVKYLEDADAFENNPVFKKTFGPLFVGLLTDHAQIRRVLSYHATIESHTQGQPELRAFLKGADIEKALVLVDAPDAPDQEIAVARETRNEINGRLERERNLLEEAKGHISLFREREEVSAEELAEIVECKNTELELTELIEASDAASFLGERFLGTATDISQLEVECDLAENLATAPDPGLAISILRSGQAGDLVTESEAFTARRAALGTDISELARSLDLPDKMRSDTTLYARLSELREAAADTSALMERSRLRRAEEALRELGLATLVDWVFEQGSDIDPATLSPIVHSVIAKNMVDHVYATHHSALQGYSGEDFNRIRAEIAEKDRQLIKMSRGVIKGKLAADANPPRGNGIGRKSTFTDMSLIANEIPKKRNKVGVRELTRRAGAALLELKPCWMMSPLAVSQYLHANICFDLVVIDEASQMTPENAIGAISRARQVVVVGDTKQLPPTSFFQKLLNDEDIDEDLREDNESVLDMANVAFMPVRQLRWHYRSRHSGLIQFSNRWMYDNKLTIFPSAEEDNPDLGVDLVQTNGVYRARTNEIEARAVVAAVVRHMEEHPDLSLGVCTMNSDQKDLILEEFERERGRNPKVQEYVRNWEVESDALEEFFIKNLETIQGDERDVMFISTLYGPEISGGKVHQRFGPVNSAEGHRRLNVLFTRAKRKIVTFTSMTASDILADDHKNKGVRMFRAWLEYSKTGFIADDANLGGDTDSPFEDYVIRQIESLGCEAVPQVGAAGYRIDIGVRHPDWPHGFIMGVECDGATYHSSKSSRDRDRLRQEVLEGLGWNLHRIWSTDWFNDPRSERDILKERIVARLAALKAEARTRIVANTPAQEDVRSGDAIDLINLVADATDVDETRIIQSTAPAEPLAPANTPTQPATKVSGDSTAAELPHDGSEEPKDLFSHMGMTSTRTDANTGLIKSTEPVIGVGSKVTIQKLSNGGGKLMFAIVENANDPEKGFLGTHTPLGQALIDGQEGDEVEYQAGSYIHEVRIVTIE